jgi:STE24 endopeptidase
MLQWLIRRRPRTWPWIAGGLLGLAIFAAGWGPYALSAGPAASPLPPGPARAALLRLIADARIPARQVYVAADPGFMVDVTGGFGQAKVVVGPRLLAAPLPEVTALTGHLMGHFAHGDVLAVYLIEAALTVLGFVAMRRLFRPAARLLGAGTAGPADPEGLPALAALALVAMAVAAPISAGYLRWANVRADAFSLDHARAPDGLAAALERDWNHESVDPSPVERAIFYTHPPLKSRLEQAMAWKAAHRN